MTDYKENALVVQSNQFVRQTSNNLKANEIKMFDIFVSCIDTRIPKTEISLTKSELLKAMGDKGSNYTTTKETLESLFKKTWREINEDATIYHHFINRIIWKHEEDEIKIRFDADIMPMLINLKKNFLQYSVADLNTLKSRYSMLMYKFILSYIRQYKTTDFILSLDEIRNFLNLNKKYTEWRDLKKYVLDISEYEINNSKSLPYLIKYIPLKKNRKTTSIQILVRPRTTNKETNYERIGKKVIYEQRYNELIKGDTPMEDILNRQADMIIEEKEI